MDTLSRDYSIHILERERPASTQGIKFRSFHLSSHLSSYWCSKEPDSREYHREIDSSHLGPSPTTGLEWQYYWLCYLLHSNK